MTKTAILISTGLIIMIGVIYFGFGHQENLPEGEEIPIIESWDLPAVLEEVSGIAYIGNKRIACIQDEDGIIFIYDLNKRQIAGKIEFAGAGDYESITLAGSTAYILKSDGTIYEVQNFLSDNPIISTLYIPGESGKNYEGLAYDAKNNRLLISIKERSGKEYRPVFSFDLQTKQFESDPVFKLSFNDPVFSPLGKKPSEKFFRPSEISIHPKTGKIFMLEGISPKILILDEDGTPEKIHILSRKQFAQAEGISFGENGEIYVSNEGSGNPPNILQISLN